MKIKNIPISQIKMGKNHREEIQDIDLQSLMDSISKDGIISPIEVVKVGRFYELVYGYRRYYACKKLKLHSIPSIITSNADRVTTLTKNLIENLHRKNPTNFEYGKFFIDLIEKEEYTAREIALMIKKNISFVQFCMESFKQVPVKYRQKIAYNSNPKERTPGTIPVSAAKRIETLKKSNTITAKDSHKLYDLAAKGTPTREIIEIAKQIKAGESVTKSIKGVKGITYITFRIPVPNSKLSKIPMTHKDRNIAMKELLYDHFGI